MLLITILIKISFPCLTKINDLSIYPTINENFSLPMEILFENNLGLKYFYWKPSNPNISIKNTIEYVSKQTQTQNETIRTISYNLSHFVGLSKEGNNLLIFDEQQKLSFSQPLDPQWQCNNAEFTIQGSIIMDCYIQNQLQFVFFENGILINVQKAEAMLETNQTQIITFVQNNTELFIIYLQVYFRYFQLSLYQKNNSDLIRLWSLPNKNNGSVVQIGFSSNNLLYLIRNHTLFQYKMQGLKYEKVHKRNFENPLVSILVKNFKEQNSQQDTIVLVFSDSVFPVQIFQAISGQIILKASHYFGQQKQNNSQSIQAQLNSQFVFVKFRDNFYLAQNQLFLSDSQNNYFYPSLKNILSNISDNSLIILSNDNHLFHFGDAQKIIFRIEQPKLIFFFPNTTENKSLFIQGVYEKLDSFCGVNVKYQVLNQSDYNVYSEISAYQPKPIVSFNNKWKIRLDTFSGSLLNLINVTAYNNYSKFDIENNLTMIKKTTISLNISAKVSKIIALKDKLEIYFLAIANGTQIQFFVSKSSVKFQNIYNFTAQLSITEIQLSISYPNNITVAVDQGNNAILLFLFQFNITNSFDFNQSSLTKTISNGNIKQFVLTFEKLIIVTNINQLIIQSWINEQIQYFSFEKINQIFYNKFGIVFQINPQSMIVNYLEQGSQIFISSENIVLVFDVDNNNGIIPIQIIYSNNLINIQQISITKKNLVILSEILNIYYAQIWNIENIFNPHFCYEIQLLNFDQNSNIFSDQLFFYTATQDLITAYQVSMSQHKALFYQFKMLMNQMTSTQSLIEKTKAIIQNGPYIFQLESIIQYEIKYSNLNNNTNFLQTNPVQYIVGSSIQQQQNVTYQQILHIFSNLTNLTLKNNSYQSTTSHPTIFLSQSQEQQFNQILNFSSVNCTERKQNCTINNYFQQNSKFPSNFTSNQTIIFNIANNTFFQNGSIIMNTSNQNSTVYKFFDNNSYYSRCLFTTTYYYNYSASLVSTICNNKSNNQYEYYLIGIYYNGSTFNNTNTTQLKSEEIPEGLFQYKSLTFVTTKQQEDDIYIILLYLNYTYNNTNNLYSICQVKNIQVAQMTQSQDSSEKIIILIVCKKLITYYFGNYSNSQESFSFINGYQHYLLLDRYIEGEFELLNIQILTKSFEELLILLSTENSGSFILELIYNTRDQILEIQNIVKIIPQYFNYALTNQIYTFPNNTYIFQVYKNQSNYSVLTLFNYNTTLNISEPLTMLGGYELIFTPSSLAIYINRTIVNNSFYYTDQNGTIYQQILQIATLNCSFRKSIFHWQQNQSCEFNASNSFNSSRFTIKFIENKNDLGEIENILLWIIIVVFGILIIYFFLKLRKNKIDEEDEDEDEKELEL